MMKILLINVHGYFTLPASSTATKLGSVAIGISMASRFIYKQHMRSLPLDISGRLVALTAILL